MTFEVPTQQIERAIMCLVEKRGPSKTICPSEVARALRPENWREAMPAIRDVAAQLVDRGKIVATQRGREIEIGSAKGPIRLGLP